MCAFKWTIYVYLCGWVYWHTLFRLVNCLKSFFFYYKCFFFCLIDKIVTCLNGGTPYLLSCQCSGSYIGPSCEFVNPCNSRPCQNGGQCTAIGQFNFVCVCTTLFTGVFCEISNRENACYDKNQLYCALLKDQCFTASIESYPVYEYCRKTCKQCKRF